MFGNLLKQDYKLQINFQNHSNDRGEKRKFAALKEDSALQVYFFF